MKTCASVMSILVPGLVAVGCSEGGSRRGSGVRVAVAPLTLPGAEDVCYGIYIQNGAGDVVASLPHICSSRYGNGDGGDISYVAPCDADPSGNVAQNKVTLVLEGVDLAAGETTHWLDETQYQNPCGWPDPASQALATSGGDALPFDTEGYDGPGASAAVNFDGFTCQRTITCEENADAEASFNLTVLRDANQGFFDVAVDFEDIFCSAKVDCAYADPAGPIELVHDPVSGERVQTVVWAFACTDGDAPGTTSETSTHLYMDDIVLDCVDAGGAHATYTIPAAAGPGNLYPGAGATPAPIVQAMEFEGREQLTNGNDNADKRYWSVALGLNAAFFAPPAPAVAPTCTLVTKATASKGALVGGTTPDDTNYPFIDVSVQINAGPEIVCTQHGLDGDNDGVETTYTGERPDQTGFATATFGNEGSPTATGVDTHVVETTTAGCPPGTADINGDASQCATFTKAGGGSGHICAITNTGALYCWGGLYGTYGTLPIRIGTASDWVMVEGDMNDGVCGIRGAEGTLWCFGPGIGAGAGGLTPVQAGSDGGWTTLDGNDGFCGIREGAMYCWWGTGPFTQVGSDSDWTAVSLPLGAFCGLRAGMVWCSGDDWAGVVTGVRHGAMLPLTQFGSDNDWSAIIAEDESVCGLRPSGLYCWGAAFGPTGLRQASTSNDWVAFGGGADSNTSYALTGDGRLFEIGFNDVVQLGTLTGWTGVGAFSGGGCGQNAGVFQCWGDNATGALGDGTYDGRSTPGPVLFP